jgi:hypothetical protein
MIGFGQTLVVVSEMVETSGFGNLNGLEISLFATYIPLFLLRRLLKMSRCLTGCTKVAQ